VAIPNHKNLVQQVATLQSGGAGPYQTYRLGIAPDHKLNNILEIGYTPNRKKNVQHGATLQSRGAESYQVCHHGRVPDHELNNILETGYITWPTHEILQRTIISQKCVEFVACAILCVCQIGS
jgi:hypothetical protein